MNIFIKHPNKMGETYWQHFFAAMAFGSKMAVAGIGCMIHGIFPFLFVKTGSNTNLKLTRHFLRRLPVEMDNHITHAISTLERVERNNKN